MQFATTSQLAFTPLSPPRPSWPMLAPPPHSSKRASLIDYLQTKEQPPPEWHYRCHPTYTRAYWATHLLSLLPNASLLSLRLVSRDTNAWVSTGSPPPLANLHIEFPIIFLPAPKYSTLKRLAEQCRHLTITFPITPLPTTPPSPEESKLPQLPNLTHLHLNCPTGDIFDRLLAFRLALQIRSVATVPKLKHLTITPLSMNGIIALRWGSFTSFAKSDWTDRAVWRGLHGLDVEILPWWDATPGERLDKAQEAIWCMGMKILHDWLNSFATAGTLRELELAWLGAEGPNPLLLDEFAAGSRRGNWFSAPPVRSRGLREVWLRGVRVEVKDVCLMKMRLEGLALLMVEGRLAGKGVRGVGRMVKGRQWFEVALGEDAVELEGAVELWGDIPKTGEHVVCTKEVESGGTMTMPALLDSTPTRGSRDGSCFQ